MGALKLRRFALHVFVLVLLGACAGGGGGGGTVPVSPPPPPPPPPPLTFPPLAPPHASGDFPGPSSAEYTASWGPAGTNAAIAWQNGATGAGVEVSVIDTGIDPNHPEFVGRVSPDSTDIISGRDALDNDETHGEEVASIIAGNYNGSQTVGLAFDATILAIRADDTAGTFFDSDLASAIDYARLHGAQVINLSLGSSDPTSTFLQNAIERATSAGIILVFSAGNEGQDGATQPDYPGFLATNSAVSHGLILIAGGLNSNGTVNTQSNPPASAANWYLTAPGWQIVVPDFGASGGDPQFQTCFTGASGALCQVQGTSYASPQVAAAVALLLQAFPGLTPAQVVQLLLSTADDTGAPGNDSLNGAGRLNIGRAFQPVGPLSVPIMAASASITPDNPVGVTGPAFGDGLRNQIAWSMVGFDHFGRTFGVNLANNWVSAYAGPSTVAQAPVLWRTAASRNGITMQFAPADDATPDSYRLPLARADLEQSATRIDANLGGGLSFSFAANGASPIPTDASEPVGHLNFVNASRAISLTQRLSHSFSLTVLSESGDAPVGLDQTLAQRSAVAARGSLAFPAGALNLTYGDIDEQNALLGLSWTDTLGPTPTGRTTFMALGGHFDVADVRVNFDAEYGTANLAGDGWLSVAEPLRTTAFSIGAEYGLTPGWIRDIGAQGNGVLGFSVSQPLRVETGLLSFMAPTATKYGIRSLRFEQRQFDPSPSGRELRFALNYSYFGDNLVSAFSEAEYVLDAGHVADAPPETVLRVGIRLAN